MNDNLMANDDSLLRKMLSYHQHFIDDAFVQKVLDKIEKAFRLRQWILFFAVLIGFASALYGVMLVAPSSWAMLEQQWQSASTMVATVSFMLLTVFLFWLFNDEFERP